LALDVMLCAAEAKRDEMLKWPTIHLSALASQVQNDWSRLGTLLAVPGSAGILAELHTSMHAKTPVQSRLLTSDKMALRQFLESAERFNRNWRAYIEALDLEPVNKPRRDFNDFYVLEKSCAFGSERVAEGFKPLDMIDVKFLYERFPLLVLPVLA
jgi:hypothetical protein